MDEIQKSTCIRFTLRTIEYNYIEIYSGGGCSSSVGMVGGKQSVSLDAQVGSTHCMVKGIIMHEIIHALGFYHMHSSMDRDGFVKINYSNVIYGLSYAFDRYTTSNFGTTYDLESVMHYTSTAFSKNGQPTIEPYDKTYIPKMGQRVRLSTGDIARINSMYQC
jgi:astacin